MDRQTHSGHSLEADATLPYRVVGHTHTEQRDGDAEQRLKFSVLDRMHVDTESPIERTLRLKLSGLMPVH